MDSAVCPLPNAADPIKPFPDDCNIAELRKTQEKMLSGVLREQYYKRPYYSLAEFPHV